MTKDSNGEPDALPDDLRSFLDAERDLDAPAAEARDRLFTRLALALLPPSEFKRNSPSNPQHGAVDPLGSAKQESPGVEVRK